MELRAPFIAVEHGTNRYVDELREETQAEARRLSIRDCSGGERQAQ